MMVTARDHVLFGILDQDVDPTAGETLTEVSRRAVAQLRAAVEARAEQRRPAVIAKGIGVSLGAAALLVLTLGVIWRVADRLSAFRSCPPALSASMARPSCQSALRRRSGSTTVRFRKGVQECAV